MIPNADYPKEFIIRTIKLIEDCYDDAKEKKLEVTFILNCLSGLIIATNENIENDNYFKNTRLCSSEVNKFIPKTIAQLNIKELNNRIKKLTIGKSLINELNSEIDLNNTIKIERYKELKNLTLRQFIRNIRNGIAHQNVKSISNNQSWQGVQIWNNNSIGIRDFEVEFTIDELKQFTLFIAKKFLEK